MKKIGILLILLLLMVSCAPSKKADKNAIPTLEPKDDIVTFEKVYGANGDEKLADIVAAGNSSFVAVGFKTMDAGQVNGYIVHLNDQGSAMDEKLFFPGKDLYFNALDNAPNDGFIIGGVYRTPGKEAKELDSDFYVIRVDQDFQLLWEQRIEGAEASECNSVATTQDGGFIAAGKSEDSAIGHGKSDFYVMKLSSTGNIQWKILLGTPESDYVRDIISLKDGGYALTGPSGTNQGDLYLYKLDSNGKTLWNYTLETQGANWCNAIAETPEGDLILAGTIQITGAQGVPGYAPFAAKVSVDGNEVWKKVFKDDGNSLFQSIAATEEGNYILSGVMMDPVSKGTDIVLTKIDKNGKVLWDRQYGIGDAGEYSNAVIAAGDGGYVSAGYTSKKRVVKDGQFDRTLFMGLDGYVVKFNSFGLVK